MKRMAGLATGLVLIVIIGVVVERGRHLDAEIMDVVSDMQQNIIFLQSETDNLIVVHRGIPGVSAVGEKLTEELTEAGLLLEEGQQAIRAARWLSQVSRQRAIGNIHSSLEIQKRVTANLQRLAEYLGEKLAVPDQSRTIAI